MGADDEKASGAAPRAKVKVVLRPTSACGPSRSTLEAQELPAEEVAARQRTQDDPPATDPCPG